uniref:Uncharacterized protein n=1 Tax=Rhizophora mucronata TaxID=61149 RepID=A0A2P2IWW9_RHIMU
MYVSVLQQWLQLFLNK